MDLVGTMWLKWLRVGFWVDVSRLTREMDKPRNITGGKTFQTYGFHMKTHGEFTLKDVD